MTNSEPKIGRENFLSETLSRESIFDISEKRLSEWFVQANGKAFWARQTLRWLFEKRVLDTKQYTDIPPIFREKLSQEFSFELPKIDSLLASSDGSEKILLKSIDEKYFECVLMPSPDRVTICVSSQVGCRMACTFCQTGRLGLSRNLTKGEILAQLLWCYKQLEKRGDDRRITNVVFMGMGEPLDNLDNVIEATRVMLAPHYFGMSKHRVTVSTCGLVPEIRRMAKEFPLRLAISLHSADPPRRTQLMPVNRQHSLEELKKALLDYPAGRDGITFEYIMLDGVNDTVEYAKKLVKFLHGLKAKVNLIPMNAHPGMEWKPSQEKNMREFQKYLSDRSIPAPIRYSRGDDISGACGQLAAKRENELHLPPKRIAKTPPKATRPATQQPTQQETPGQQSTDTTFCGGAWKVWAEFLKRYGRDSAIKMADGQTIHTNQVMRHVESWDHQWVLTPAGEVLERQPNGTDVSLFAIAKK